MRELSFKTSRPTTRNLSIKQQPLYSWSVHSAAAAAWKGLHGPLRSAAPAGRALRTSALHVPLVLPLAQTLGDGPALRRGRCGRGDLGEALAGERHGGEEHGRERGRGALPERGAPQPRGRRLRLPGERRRASPQAVLLQRRTIHHQRLNLLRHALLCFRGPLRALHLGAGCRWRPSRPWMLVLLPSLRLQRLLLTGKLPLHHSFDVALVHCTRHDNVGNARWVSDGCLLLLQLTILAPA
mmetsp:Transcript_111028/g.344318  ORF Transcript_111028/g.344318 Transcript_111028/m.344318 type:complete len:240 (+) Transcript_111028:3-722(+)